MSDEQDSPEVAAAIDHCVQRRSEFERFLPGFAEAMDRRFFTPEWLRSQVWSGAVKFWSTPSSAITAELKSYPTGVVVLHGLYATGNVRAIVDDLIPQAEAWARSLGATSAIIDSREAWQRILEPHGYEPYKSAVLKEL